MRFRLPRSLSSGFTMIELLVVIAVIGVLAVAVLSSINPIEQINKSRDTRTRSDAEQLISATDRYYAIHEVYPWNDVGSTGYAPTTTLPDDELDFNSADVGSDFRWVDVLADTAEVKEGFTNRLKLDKKLYIYKEGEYNATMYVCFKPTSLAFQQEAGKNCANGTTPTGLSTSVPFCATTDGTPDKDNYICLP